MYKIFKRLTLFLILVSNFTGIWGAALSSDSKIISYSELANSEFDTLIVAKVGDIEITAKEFLLGYEYGPAFIKRGNDSRKHYLDFLINEKLLALDGYSNGLDSSRLVTETLEEIEGDLATEELYKEDILSQVSVPEEEIAEGIEREKVHVSLKWLYAPTFDEISELQERLKSGIPFDSLFVQQLSDSVVMEDRFMETTRFKLLIKNPTLSAIVDTLQYGENSSSIGTADGWYIVRIVDLWTSAITTESEQNRIHYDVNRALFKRKADALSDRYVRQMMLAHDPVIRRRTFDLLRAYIGKSIFSQDKFSEWELTKKLMAEYGPIDSVKIDEHLDETLVQLRDEDVLLKDFLVWYRAREPNIRFSTASPQRFFVSLEQLIWRMVRDKLLVDEAVGRNLQHREIVETQKQWWRDKCVYTVAKAQLANTIQLNDKEIIEFYEKNKNKYRQHGEFVLFEKIKKEVQRDVYHFKCNQKLLHHILALKRKYPIEINEHVLMNLPIDIENQANAIDVYVAKKGGTFPRPAYPTIDYEWKAWY